MVKRKEKKQTDFKDKILLGVIIILITIAGILGFLIFKNTVQDSPSPSPKLTISTSPQPANFTQADVSKVLPGHLTDEERRVLIPPSSTASKEEIDTHFALADKIAQETNTIEINGCATKPIAIRVQNNSSIKVVNNDSIQRKLYHEDFEFIVPPQFTKEFMLDVKKGPGIYGYICEGLGLTGYILVR